MQNTENEPKGYYPVVEIFQSIQGEGVYTGTLAIFVRFAGCNLRCEWCDTKESWNIPESIKTTKEKVLTRILSYEADLIVFTGGEPTLYMDKIAELVTEIRRKKPDATIAIETNGTNPVDRDVIDWVTCSPKPPAYAVKCKYDELKYVVDDYFSLGVIGDREKLSDKQIWLQVESNKSASAARIMKILRTNKRYRLGAQLHQLLKVR